MRRIGCPKCRRRFTAGTSWLRRQRIWPAGSIRVELVLTVDVESILGVTARELSTGREASVTIRPSGGLSAREIVEIINRRRQDPSVVSTLPLEGGNVVRVATREQAAVKPSGEK